MNVIRALIVDDDTYNTASVRRRFDTQFHKLHWDVEWVAENDPDCAQRIITTQSSQFDLFIIDLLYKRADLGEDLCEPRGLELIAEARERFPDAYILAISGGDSGGSRPDLFEDAKSYGARRAIRRVEFSIDSKDNNPAAIAREIVTHLLDTGAASSVKVTVDEYDPNIQAVIFAAGGRGVLSRLYSRTLTTAGHTTRAIELAYLTPGASGAFVCAVAAHLDDLGAPVHHAMKISPDRDALVRETERGAAAATVLPAWLLVRQQPDRPVGPVNGWYALVSQLQSRATTLRDWLRAGPSQADVASVFETLFTHGLGSMYGETQLEAESATDLLRMPLHRQRLVLHAIAELGPAIGHRDGCGLDDVERRAAELTAFITEGRVGNATRRTLAQPSHTTYAHGDLHGGNVLLVTLGRRPAPLLIDMNDFGRAHWAVDPAHLAVDLLMRNIDGGVHSMFFSGFPVWREHAARVGALEPLSTQAPNHDANRPAVTALNWLTSNIRAFCPSLSTDTAFARHRWEWHVALATHLLRAGYHLSIPGPKRALAVVAAHDQLACAEKALAG
jgi:hypothetical protein